MNEIVLIKPDKSYSQEIEILKKELTLSGDKDSFAGCCQLERFDAAEDWIDFTEKCRKGETELVPANVYLALRRTDNRIVGVIDLRHHIDHPILGTWGGHIGYIVRPGERGRGYGKEMLRLCLENCRSLGLDRVMVTCHTDNPASERIIRANGGVFEKEIIVDGRALKRFFIQVG